jgi:hypothetical protein
MPMDPQLEKLVDDLLATAALAEVPAEPEAVRRDVAAFAESFRGAAIETRTTTKPVEERGLSYRFVELDRPTDPHRQALDAGLLSPGDRPVDRLVPELKERFEILGWGVDFEVSHGLEKIWPFLACGYPVEEACALSSLPAAVRDHADFFARHGLTHFSIVAADYRHESANLYFMIPPDEALSEARIDAMLDELGMPALREMVRFASRGVALNLTFRYDAPDIQRLCLYVPAPTAADVPVSLDPLLERLVERAPVRADHRSFIPGATFTRSGPYMKLEVDYTGTTLAALQRCVAVRPLAA